MSEQAQNLHNLFPNLDFDPEALRAKYKAERDKRLRDDEEGQYVEVKGDFARYNDEDPYADPDFTREPIRDHIEVAIVGGGFSGMMAGARLKEQGIEGVHIIEAGADFGGTWYWNRYPGAQCDIESYCYLPLLEETGYMPKEKYSFAPEIFDHCKRLGEYFGLYDNAIFQTRVREVRWQEDEQCWLITTDRDDEIRANFVIQSTGPASRPKLPGIPGIEDFKGHSFHTCRWDYDYTGGDHTGGLTKLKDKRIAIIGTGATAIQCVPFLGEHAKQLYVFQRTPSSVDLRGNSQTDEEWWQSLEPGWQRARRENFANVLNGVPVEEDLVSDGWTDIARKIGFGLMQRNDDENVDMNEMMLRAEIADFEKMNEIRKRVDEVVTDPKAKEALKPWYRQFCKRPTFNDQYLATFNRPNVELIDVSDAKGVERITENSIIANGKEYEIDCLIYATGFEITTSVDRRVDFNTYGRDGLSLFDHWHEGYRTLHGLSSHGFPNWFTIGINQNGLSPNMTSMFDDQALHVAHIIHEVKARDKKVIEVTKDAEEGWVNNIIALAGMMPREFQDGCTPGYYNNEGRGVPTLQNAPFIAGINAFNALLAAWREKGDLEGYDIA